MKPLVVGCAVVSVLAVQALQSQPGAQAAAPGTCAPSSATAFGSTTKGELSIEGKIYFIPEKAEKLPNFATLKSQGSIFTDRWEVGPREFTTGFPGLTDRFEWFAIDYQGPIYVPVAGAYTFRLASDDGSKLYIDGVVVVDLDGVHGWDGMDGTVKLTQGDHGFRLSYFQGPATQLGLTLWVTPPGADEPRIFRLQDFNKAVVDSRRLLAISENKEEIRIRFGSEVLFDTGKYALKALAAEALKQLASVLRAYPGFPIVIEGHTDSVGNAASNQVLSDNRAKSVRDWLVTTGQIAPACVSTKGFGMTEPVADNGTADGRQKNRRVEIKIEKGGGPVE